MLRMFWGLIFFTQLWAFGTSSFANQGCSISIRGNVCQNFRVPDNADVTDQFLDDWIKKANLTGSWVRDRNLSNIPEGEYCCSSQNEQYEICDGCDVLKDNAPEDLANVKNLKNILELKKTGNRSWSGKKIVVEKNNTGVVNIKTYQVKVGVNESGSLEVLELGNGAKTTLDRVSFSEQRFVADLDREQKQREYIKKNTRSKPIERKDTELTSWLFRTINPLVLTLSNFIGYILNVLGADPEIDIFGKTIDAISAAIISASLIFVIATFRRDV